MTEPADPDALAVRLQQLAARTPADRRTLVGIAGRPGAGKSTLAAAVADRFGPTAVAVGMDGFHLADVVLDQLGLTAVKGAPATFDPDGYRVLLSRLRTEPGPVFAPGFERTLEQPVAQAVMVGPQHRVVITEGNYLLLAGAAWGRVRDQLDQVWWLEGDEGRRIEWLRRRHVRHGKTPREADAWMARVDGPNAELAARTADRADLVVRLDEWV